MMMMRGVGLLFCCGIELALIAVTFAGLWKTFEKMGKPGWAGIVPVYNIIVLLEVIRKPIWWIALFFIPFVNIVMLILVGIEVAKCFGKEAGFGVGLGLLGFVFYPILGFGSARFIGPDGFPGPSRRRDERDDFDDDEDRPRRRRRERDVDDDDRIRSDEPPRKAPPPPPAAITPAAPTDGTVMIQCAGCQRKLKVPANVVGKKVKCPGCGATFVAG